MTLSINNHYMLLCKLPHEIISKIFLYLETSDAIIVKSKIFKEKRLLKIKLYSFMNTEFNWFYNQCCSINIHYPCNVCKNNYQFNQERCSVMKYFMNQFNN